MLGYMSLTLGIWLQTDIYFFFISFLSCGLKQASSHNHPKHVFFREFHCWCWRFIHFFQYSHSSIKERFSFYQSLHWSSLLESWWLGIHFHHLPLLPYFHYIKALCGLPDNNKKLQHLVPLPRGVVDNCLWVVQTSFSFQGLFPHKL